MGVLVGYAYQEPSEYDEGVFQGEVRLRNLSEAQDVPILAVTCGVLAEQPHLAISCLDARCSVDAPFMKAVPGIAHIPKGQAPLQNACLQQPSRQLEVMKVLIHARANLERQNSIAACLTEALIEWPGASLDCSKAQFPRFAA